MAIVAACYLWRNNIFAAPTARMERGPYLETTPVRIAALDVHRDVGTIVEEALNASGGVIPKSSLVNRPWPTAEASGAKSQREFLKGLRHCEIERTDDSYVITPLRPSTGENFEDDPDNALTLPRPASIADLGENVARVLSQCRAHA